MGSDMYVTRMVSWDYDENLKQEAKNQKKARDRAFVRGYESAMNIAIKNAIRLKASKKVIARLEELLANPPKGGK